MMKSVNCWVWISAFAFICMVPKASMAQASSHLCMRWIDAKTGESVPTVPTGSTYSYTDSRGIEHTSIGIDPDGKHGHNPITGQNFVRIGDGSWIDAKTGNPVPTVPAGSTQSYTDSRGITHMSIGLDADGNHGHNPNTGQNYVRVPCPPSEGGATRSLPPRESAAPSQPPPQSPPPRQRTATYSGLHPAPAPSSAPDRPGDMCWDGIHRRILHAATRDVVVACPPKNAGGLIPSPPVIPKPEPRNPIIVPRAF